MTKSKVSVTLSRELLQEVDQLCHKKGENRSALLETLLWRGLQVEGPSRPGGFLEYFRLQAPLSVIKAVVRDLEVIDDTRTVEMVLRSDEVQWREWLAQVRAEAAQGGGDKK